MMTTSQQEAFEKFRKLKVGALFMRQGTGKTKVAVDLVNHSKADFALFVCPFSTKENLKVEIEKWNLNIEYMIVGYETLSNSDRKYLELMDLVKSKNRLFIVADESVFIKNATSKRSLRMLELAKYSEYRLILNGTPITKNEWDIYNQMEFLSPKILKMSRIEFLNTFFTLVRFKKKNHSPHSFYKLSEVNIDYLHKLINPYIFECDLEFDKDEANHYIMIESSEDTYYEYQRLKKDLLEALANYTADVKMFVNMAVCAFSDECRHHQIANKLKDAGQIIVFCTLLSEIRNISKELDCYVITGETPPDKREIIKEKFKNDNKPLLMTLGTGAYGLNMQFCNKIAFASITFDFAKIEQATSRIKRIGQTQDIEYTWFDSNIKIYDMIQDNISKKRYLKELIIDKMNKEGVGYFEKIL